jgi:hypothetical protein
VCVGLWAYWKGTPKDDSEVDPSSALPNVQQAKESLEKQPVPGTKDTPIL